MLIKNEEQLINFVKYSPIVVITIIAVLVNILIFLQNKSNYEKDLEIYKKNYIETNKALVKAQVEKVYNDIINEQEEHKDDLQESLEKRLEEAHSIVKGIHEKYKNKPKEKVLEIIKEALRGIRFNDGRGYYFVFSMDGTNILHPISKKIEGKNLYNRKNYQGVYFVQEIIKNLKEKDVHTIKGRFHKPYDKENTYDKVMSHRIYRPLDIYIGTGEYVEDYLKNMKEYILEEHIQNVSFGKNGYVFVFDYDGVQLAHIKKSYIGVNRIDLTDANGYKITQGIIDAAKKGSGYVKYIGTIMPETGLPAHKTTYVKGMDAWGWAIGAGFYDKELYAYLETKKKDIEKLNEESLKRTAIITLVLTVFLFFIAVYITKVLERFFKEYKNRIEEEISENRRKDLVLYQQSKMASMGEMLGNIAHQWRQPLSTISTIASGSKLQKELEMLEDKEFNEGMGTIVNTTKYLSQTIDDFRNFFNPDKVENEHTTKVIFDKSLQLLSVRLQYQEIEIISDIENIEIVTYENELVQSIINILNNAIDAFEEKEVDRRLLFVEIKSTKECKMPNCEIVDCETSKKGFIEITIKDNAGGIPLNVKDKIFDVYFTTKHKSQGTGIGLYMTYEIVTKHLEGSISVINDDYVYENNNYTGAKFTIVLPQK